jgi:muconolactone D-isomerase
MEVLPCRTPLFMEFLVRIEVHLPHEMPDERPAELAAAEHAYGKEMQARGVIKRIRRLPGGLRNVGIWEAADATELHERLMGLPLYPWITSEVSALAVHPLQAAG